MTRTIDLAIPADPAVSDRPSESLHVAVILPTLNPYGGVISVVNFINHIIRRGNRVTLISLSQHGRDLVYPYTEPIYVPPGSVVGRYAGPALDIVMATSWHTVDLAVTLAETSGAQAVYFVQGFEPDLCQDEHEKARALATYDKISHRIVKTRYLQARLQKEGGWGSYRIPPGMDLSLFYPRQEFEKRERCVLAMARPDAPADHRGFKVLQEVFRLLHEYDPTLRLRVFGTDDESLFDHPVDVLGRLAPSALPEVYSQAAVYVDTSLLHGFGRTGVEAMACGTPCVLSDSGGVREYAIPGKNCLMVEPGNALATVEAVTRILEDQVLAKQLVEEGRRSVSGYSDDKAAEALLAVFHSVLDGKGLVDKTGTVNAIIAPDPVQLSAQRFRARNAPRRVLVNSVPKSGTTWMRTMVRLLPGYTEYPLDKITGLDPQELRDVAPGQVFHGHFVWRAPELHEIIREMEFAVVFVYRDLRDVVVSDYFHRSALNPKRRPPIFDEVPFEELFRPAILQEWCGSAKRYPDIRHWIRNYPSVRYEDLKRDCAGELHRVFTEMGFAIDIALCEHIAEEAAFDRLSGRKPGQEDVKSPLRKGVVGDWKNYFRPDVYAEFIEVYGDLLVEYGYEL